MSNATLTEGTIVQHELCGLGRISGVDHDIMPDQPYFVVWDNGRREPDYYPADVLEIVHN